jgi:hypothetical protein
VFVHRPEPTSISKESPRERIKKEPVPRYRPRDRSNYSIAGWNTRRDSSTSTDATLVIVLAVDHRGRQLAHRAIGLVISDRGMLLSFLLLALATVQA